MNSEGELVVIFGALHLVAAVLGGVLLYLFLRADRTKDWAPPSEDDEPGGGGNDRVGDPPRQTPPRGGVPLPDARQSTLRLRGPGRLSDARPWRGRRTAPEPVRTPARTPARR